MLYVLRDNVSLTRAANVEFDLEAMFDGDVFSDFKLLFLLCHESRVEIPSDGKPEDCWLEKWSKLADDQGTRAREKLRDGVENAIKALGAGFLTTKGNAALRERLSSGELATQDYYRQLLRMVYRLLLLLVAEEKKDENGRNLLHPPGTPEQSRQRYAQYYSVGRLRTLAGKRRGTTHTDLYDSLKLLFLKLRTGYGPLGIPGLGSFLFSPTATPDLDAAPLTNEFLLDATRALCITDDTSGRGGVVRRPVDFANLGSDELGSVYESLLELHPKIDTDEGPFSLGTAAGHERKTTGSYYTPTSLINCLLDSALDPVVKGALNKPTGAEAEKALLNLKVCDPACGSGHFLIAAAERLAKHLASLRTGDEEPSTLAIQHAKRDIIGRCIYGVDMNPMAVELCQVALWIEALDPGRPFSFLEHHIQCGNSLLGTTPALLNNGIPDDAFLAIEGDAKTRVSALKKQNKQERKDYAAGQGYLFDPPFKLVNLAVELASINDASGDTPEEVAEKERRYAEFVKGSGYQYGRLLADTWCAAFVWKKDDSELGKLCPTERDFRKVESHATSGLLPHVKAEILRLAGSSESGGHQFFHWHLAFPDVFRLPEKDEVAANEHTGWMGGFDIILGNPPWERIKIQEDEWFAASRPDIASASTAAVRTRLIDGLRNEDALLFAQFKNDQRHVEGTNHFIRNSHRYPLCARGEINTYSIFAELNASIIARQGLIGCILQAGIATDNTTRFFFEDIVNRRVLHSLYSFDNKEKLFPAVKQSTRFCLITIGGAANTNPNAIPMVFYAQSIGEARNPDRQFTLTAHDIAALNPNTRTCPVFRSRRDASVIAAIYRRSPVIVNDGESTNHWDLFIRRVFDMNKAENSESCSVAATTAAKSDDVAMFEAKLVDQFNHRKQSYINGRTQAFDTAALIDPNKFVLPRYWIPRAVVESSLPEQWSQQWLLTWQDITDVNTMARTVSATVLPRAGTDFTLRVGFPCLDPVLGAVVFSSGMNSFIFDYVSRQMIGGIHLSDYIFKQLPLPTPLTCRRATTWDQHVSIEQWLRQRVLELSYTAWDLAPFARDCGYVGPPFRWNEERRSLLRAELDAAFFHLYLPSDTDGHWITAQNEAAQDVERLKESFLTPRDAVAYIMDTFAIVRRKDEEKYGGEYRSKRLILESYDALQVAIRTRQPYQTRLDPAPGAPVNSLPEWEPNQPKPENWPSHIHCPQGYRITPADEWLLADVAEGAMLPQSFKLVLDNQAASTGVERRWKCKTIADGDELPAPDTWVLVRHPDLKRGNTAVPVALGKLTYQELTDANTKQKLMVVTLRGPVPPSQVRIPLEDWPSFRPLAVLDPLDT